MFSPLLENRFSVRCYISKTFSVDQHSSEYGGGQGFSNGGYGSYGNDFNGGYGSSEDGSYGSMNNGASPYDMPFGEAGSMYGNAGNNGYGNPGGYVNPQESVKFNSPFFYEQQGVYSPSSSYNRKPNYPPISYPRAHRLPNKSLQSQGRNPLDYYSPYQGSNFSNNNNNANNVHDSVSSNSKEIPSTSSQIQPNTQNQLYFTVNSATQSGSSSGSENSETKFSQPVYNPSSYAEYVLSQQQSNQQSNFAKNSSEQYSQAYNGDTSTQSAATPGIETQATRMHSTYQPFPSNVHNPYSVSQSSNSFNNIPHHQSPSDYSMMKSRFPHMKINNGYEQAFKQQNAFHNGNAYNAPWNLANQFTTLNNNYNHQPMRHRNRANFYQSQAMPEYNRNNQNFNNKEVIRNNINPQVSYNPYEGINQNNYKQMSNDAYAHSGNSFSSNSYSNSYTPQSQFQNSGRQNFSPEGQNGKNANINDIPKYNEKFDQSFNPNMYSSKANSVGPNTFTPSGVSASYSSNNANNDHGTQNMHENNNYFDTEHRNIDDNSYQHKPYNYGDNQSYSPKIYNSNSGVIASKEQNRPDSMSNQGNLVNADSPNPYNQLLNNYPSSYTDNDYSKNSQHNSPQSNYQFQSLSNSGYQSYNNSSPSSNDVSNTASDQTDSPVSFSYGFRHQDSQSQPTYTGSYYSNSLNNVQYSPQSDLQYQQQDSFTPLLDMQSSSQSVTKNKANVQSHASPSFQGYDPKLDEMEQHVQTSSSSIINVYTNSPNSKEAQKGQTFSFIDTGALDSSPSVYYASPESGAKNGYSNVDMQVVQGPTFSHDPNEPLQTSLDAYSPPHPVYRPSPSSQNTVYKEAMTVSDQLYKEATTLNNDIKSKTR